VVCGPGLGNSVNSGANTLVDYAALTSVTLYTHTHTQVTRYLSFSSLASNSCFRELHENVYQAFANRRLNRRLNREPSRQFKILRLVMIECKYTAAG